MHTFNEAADSYISMGGEARYVPKLLAYFSGRDVTSIVPAEFRQAALDLLPTNKNSSRNRQVICPGRAIMYHAHDMGWCGPMRIKRFRTERTQRHKPVDGEWLSKFINQCDRDGIFHIAALALFMNHTAARVSEAINLHWEHVDLKMRVATLVKTKTDTMAIAYLTDELMFRFYNMQRVPGERVFRIRCRHSVNDRFKAVCRRAGIEYHSSHSVGRYSFATNALRDGHDIKTAMEAGRWRSSTIFLETYVHPERAGRAVADSLNKRRYSYL